MSSQAPLMQQLRPTEPRPRTNENGYYMSPARALLISSSFLRRAGPPTAVGRNFSTLVSPRLKR